MVAFRAGTFGSTYPTSAEIARIVAWRLALVLLLIALVDIGTTLPCCAEDFGLPVSAADSVAQHFRGLLGGEFQEINLNEELRTVGVRGGVRGPFRALAIDPTRPRTRFYQALVVRA